jgi:superfamily II DNA/RNA helicase
LAVQIQDELRIFSKNLRIYSTLCIGGTNISRQVHDLQRQPHFVIGTPGRLKDLFNRRSINFAQYSSIVLDEVDRMLDMGFIPDIKFIISHLPRQRQSLFFSATLPKNVQDLAHSFLNNPLSVSVRQRQSAANVDQDIIRTNGKNKVDLLHQLLVQDGFDKVLVFGKTKWGIDKLVKVLIEKGHQVAAIHGNKSQHQRQNALDQFKKNKVKVLLATDIASRGLDINDITHVINFDLPQSMEDYIHRIGRTGRAAKKGTAITFVD